MSALISLTNIDLSYGSEPLLDGVDLQLQSGERVCLIGRNGAGKSSLLKIIAGDVMPDAGRRHASAGLVLARLEQALITDPDSTVYDTLASEFDQRHVEAWQSEQWIEQMVSSLDLSATQTVSTLSGGKQRRVALAKALVGQPELLLLDEPTNHLDIDTIQWLETQLLAFKGGVLFITHDRWLLKQLATRIIELDRGQLTSWPGDYANFLRRKEAMLAAEDSQHKAFDKKLAAEERWIRQGIKARRTRNEGRVRALKAMRKERQQRRVALGKAKLQLNEAAVSGKLIVDLDNISYVIDDQMIVQQFSMRVMQGDRIGLMGPNGVGKTTLLKLMLGQLAPTTGQARLGTKLKVAYFDQTRAALNPNESIMESVAGGRTSIEVNGKEKHIVSYMADFLFPASRLQCPVGMLSGGECNRLLLAKLFSTPANVLVMDEPTNDLDIETLELLEELLLQFQGTLLLVSHDRAFMDNIVTHTLAFEGKGKISQYIGGYQDIKAQVPPDKQSVKPPEKKVVKQAGLDFQERKELSKLPAKVEKLEAQKKALFDQLAAPGFYDQPDEIVEQFTEQLKDIEHAIEQAYARWDALESRAL